MATFTRGEVVAVIPDSSERSLARQKLREQYLPAALPVALDLLRMHGHTGDAAVDAASEVVVELAGAIADRMLKEVGY